MNKTRVRLPTPPPLLNPFFTGGVFLFNNIFITMKYKISNERLKQLIFKLLNKELEERGRFHSWVDSYAYTDLRVDDEYGGLMVLVDE